MSGIRLVGLGKPALLEFRGPDAVRFLNGQLTQDVRKVVGGKISLPSCVTDAKGRLQFRVRITESDDGALWIEGPEGRAEELEARLTRYLIADDVEVADLTGTIVPCHLIGPVAQAPAGVIARRSNRFGCEATDWWMPWDAGSGRENGYELPEGTELLYGDELEALRIGNGIPAWGSELVEGLLPPEAALEDTDISYSKGCYIGQEVISRIKSAGKVNKRLTRFICDAAVPHAGGPLQDAGGKPTGELTSISPTAESGLRQALGFAKRGTEEWFFKLPDGTLSAVRIL